MKAARPWISVVSIFLILLSLIEVSFYIQFRKYELFYQPPPVDVDELNHRLYSVLDPVLGYSHYSEFQANDKEKKLGIYANKEKTKNLGNGFVALENILNQKPVKIVVLGESTSDPYLFNGNWPWSLHELLTEKKISHIIYNGAVSGYTSTQQLIKLIRDVLYLDTPDIVIVLNGLTDVPAIGDIVENHPGVHVYQKFLSDLLTGNPKEGRDPKLLPNTQFGLSRIYYKYFASAPAFIQYGVANTDSVGSFVKNIKLMNAVCRTNKISFYHFLGQVQQNQNQTDNKSYPLKDYKTNEIQNLSVREFFEKSENLLKNEKYSRSLFRALPLNQPLFIDIGHINSTGAKIIAEKIFSELESEIKILKLR